MHKKIFLVLIAGTALFIGGCNRPKEYVTDSQNKDIRIMLDTTENSKIQEKTDFSRGDLFTMFEEKNNEEVMDFQYGDYNKDGMHEAFVLTDSDGYKLWYMHASGCELVADNFTEDDTLSVEVLDFSTKTYLLLHRLENDRKNTLVYTLDNKNQVTQSIVSGKGYLMKDTGKNLILRVYSEGGEETDYCEYYLYYNPDEGFKEYGGIPIAEEQFLEFDGAQDILNEVKSAYEDGQVDISYVYRSNHYMHMNMLFYRDGKMQYQHTTLKYDNQKVTMIGETIINGREEVAHLLGSATFPTAFKHPDTIRKE